MSIDSSTAEVPSTHDAVDRDLLARPDDDDVADDDLLDGDVDLLAAAHDAGGLGGSPMSFLIASLVRPLARASSSLPSSTKVMSSALVS